MRLLRGFLICFIMQSTINTQFLEQPDQGTLFAPVQDQVTFICSVEEGYSIDWFVGIPGGPLIRVGNMIIHDVLTMERNFSLEGVSTNRSILSLWETETHINNGTNITCIAEMIDVVVGNTVTVIFYDIPLPPAILSVTENELGLLNISWFLGFIEGVPVNYTLTVLNLNTTSAQPIIIAGLLDHHYVFETSRPCDVYSFTVTAVTAVGNSTPSQDLIFNSISSQCICSLYTWSTTTEDESGPRTSSTQLTTTSSQDSSTTTTCSPTQNIISTLIVSVVLTVLLSISVLGNVIMCAHSHKKKKRVITSDLPDPVYETPKDVTSTKNAETPFAMTTSSAYGVSHPQVNLVPTTLSSAYNSS